MKEKEKAKLDASSSGNVSAQDSANSPRGSIAPTEKPSVAKESDAEEDDESR